jgi:hypothetical protein
MINTKSIESLIELCLLSGFIKDDEPPLSMILIANPESGKTKLIDSLDCPNTLETSDLSSKAITEVIIKRIDDDKNPVNHIIIPDFIKVMAHKQVVVQSTMAFLNALMEEGIKRQLYYGSYLELRKRRKVGLLTSVTTDYYFKMFRTWHEIGFTSRFIHVSFEYSNDTIHLIHQAIKNNTIFNDYKKMKKPKRTDIKIPNEISEKLLFIVETMLKSQQNNKIRFRAKGGKLSSVSLGDYGFRLHKQIRKLLKSIALKNHRNYVTWSDLNNELIPLLDYIRLPKNPKVI